MKPNQPIQNRQCKSGCCKPTFNPAESWLNRQPVVAKVEIPDGVVVADDAKRLFSEQVKLGEGLRIMTPGEVEAARKSAGLTELTKIQWKSLQPKPSKLPWILVAGTILFSFLLTHKLVSEINKREQAIDALIELLDEVTAPLPQGNGEIETPGVLPPKGWIDPRTII